MAIRYALNPPAFTVADFVRVLGASSLGARRPLTDTARMARMLEHANVLVVAYAAGEPVGVARAWTDHAYACYLADLVVVNAYQRQGIGRELIRQVKAAAGPESMLLLLAAPEATAYYPHLGFEKVERAWFLPREA